MKKTFFVNSCLLAGVMVFIVMLTGADVSLYVDIPSIVILIVPAFLVLSSSFSIAEIGRAFAAPFDMNPAVTDLKKSEEFFKAFRRTLWVMGLVAFIMGNIAMFKVMAEDQYFQGFSVAILAILYALMADIILINPYLLGIRKRLAEQE